MNFSTLRSTCIKLCSVEERVKSTSPRVKHSAMSLHKARLQENVLRLSQEKWGRGTQPLWQFHKPTVHSVRTFSESPLSHSLSLLCYILWVPCLSWLMHLIPIKLNEFTRYQQIVLCMQGATIFYISQETRCHRSNLTQEDNHSLP